MGYLQSRHTDLQSTVKAGASLFQGLRETRLNRRQPTAPAPRGCPNVPSSYPHSINNSEAERRQTGACERVHRTSIVTRLCEEGWLRLTHSIMCILHPSTAGTTWNKAETRSNRVWRFLGGSGGGLTHLCCSQRLAGQYGVGRSLRTHQALCQSPQLLWGPGC